MKGNEKHGKSQAWKAALIAITCILLSAGSYYMGTQYTEEKSINELIQGSSSDITVSTNTIALVNADTGTAVDGENINYASKLITSLPENFVTANLSDARDGVASGKYAAYIIIPSTFSNSVISLNTSPQQAKIEYTVNEDLDEDTKVQTIYDVVDFEHQLKNDMSYMYLSSLLADFHNAQDSTETIMENDKRDTDALLAITANDLTKMITLPTLGTVDNSIPPLDVSSYDSKNAEDLAAINDSYANFIALSSSDLEELKTAGVNLVGQLSSMEDTLNAMDLTKDDEGNVVYNTEAINSQLALYNEVTLTEKEAEIADKFTEVDHKLSEIRETIDNRKNELDTLITNYNANQTAAIPDIAANMKTDIESLLEIATTLSVQVDTSGTQITVSQDGFECGTTTTLPSDLTADEVSNLAVELSEIFGFINFTPTVDQLAIENVLNDTLIPFDDSVTNVETEETKTLRDWLLDDSAAAQMDMETETVKVIPKLDSATISASIYENVVNPLTARAEGLKTNLVSVYQNEKTALAGYNSSLTTYDPLGNIDQQTIDQYQNDMQANNAAIQSTVASNYTDNMNYVSDVTQNAQDNVSSLTQNIQEQTDASNQAVADGLSQAQELKKETSETNQLLLSDFAAKLPYTRLGNLEYTKAYEFIADPSVLVYTKADNTQSEATEAAVPTTENENDTSNKLWNPAIIYLILGILVVAVITTIVVSARQRKKSTIGNRNNTIS